MRRCVKLCLSFAQKIFGEDKNETRMTGHVAIVTGAESGVGFEVAKSLCEAGNDVILACKDETQSKVAIDKIKEQAPDAVAAFMQVGD